MVINTVILKYKLFMRVFFLKNAVSKLDNFQIFFVVGVFLSDLVTLCRTACAR